MIYLMKRKSEVFERFQEYEALVAAQFGLRLIVDREYGSTAQKGFYKKKGIQTKATVASAEWCGRAIQSDTGERLCTW